MANKNFPVKHYQTLTEDLLVPKKSEKNCDV